MDKEVRKIFTPKKGTNVFLNGFVDGTDYATFEVTPENEKYRVVGGTDNLNGLDVVVNDFDGIAKAVTDAMGLTMPGQPGKAETPPATETAPTEDMLVADIHEKMDSNTVTPPMRRSIATNSDGTFNYSTFDDVLDVITILLSQDRYKGLSVANRAVAKRIEAERQARSLENEAKATAARADAVVEKEEENFNKLVPLFLALKGNSAVPTGWEQYDVTDYVDAENEGFLVPFSIISSPAGLVDDGGELSYKLMLDPNNTNNFTLSPVNGPRIADGISSFDNAMKLMQAEYKKSLPEFIQNHGEDNPDYSAQLNTDVQATLAAAPKKPRAKKAKSWQQFFDASDVAKIEGAIKGGLDVSFFASDNNGKPSLNFDTPRGYISIDLTVESEREAALVAIDKWLADAPVRARKQESDQLFELLKNKRATKGWKLKEDHSTDIGITPNWALNSPAAHIGGNATMDYKIQMDPANPWTMRLLRGEGEIIAEGLSSFNDVKAAAKEQYIKDLPGFVKEYSDNSEFFTPQLFDDIDQHVPATASEPDQGADPVLDKHLDTLKRIANSEMGMQEASAALEEIGQYLEEHDKVDEFEGELTQAVDAVTDMVKAQFSKVG